MPAPTPDEPLRLLAKRHLLGIQHRASPGPGDLVLTQTAAAALKALARDVSSDWQGA
jgi:hypothetical protein